MRYRLNIDGGVRTGGVHGPTGGKTGRASLGFVITDPNGEIVREGGMEIGEATVNEAEYSALITGLYNCQLLNALAVEVLSDSQVLVRQMKRVYQVRAMNLYPYWQEAQRMCSAIGDVSFQWVPREKNKYADALTEIYLGKRG